MQMRTVLRSFWEGGYAFLLSSTSRKIRRRLVQHVRARNQHSASGGKKSSSKERRQLLIQFDGHGGKIDHSIADLSAATENRRDG